MTTELRTPARTTRGALKNSGEATDSTAPAPIADGAAEGKLEEKIEEHEKLSHGKAVRVDSPLTQTLRPIFDGIYQLRDAEYVSSLSPVLRH
ncbi:hypothetical protein D0Z00_002921 [Geotrichum galactomycetum]|uniref:Uncharacterized protein n=1 Tax=Geotrichum galactomycetum TaxID=27317 RepID=A0ACB6V2Q4_9ASCO|nr:hypothetical protein D0Z00_002921 [Geotrichum candidum]